MSNKPCQSCGEEVPTTHKRRKFCSDKCRVKSVRVKRLARLGPDFRRLKTNERRGQNMHYFLQGLIYGKDRRETLSITDLEELHVAQNGLCAVTGQVLTNVTGKRWVRTNASIDRIIPGGPYTKANIRLVCSIVNTMRSDMSDIEMRYWAEKILNGVK